MQQSPHSFLENAFIIICIVAAFAIAAFGYALPSIIAFRRQHPNRWFIAVLNIVFGYTLLGWLVALVWALKAFHLGGGGDSGLNLFINDTKKVQLMHSPTSMSEATSALAFNITAELEKLHRLLTSQVITQAEFETMKARLLSGVSA